MTICTYATKYIHYEETVTAWYVNYDIVQTALYACHSLWLSRHVHYCHTFYLYIKNFEKLTM